MSLTTPVYPGVNLDANNGPQMNAVATVFIVLSFTTLVLRFLSRLSTHIAIEVDDWLIVIAAVELPANLFCAVDADNSTPGIMLGLHRDSDRRG